MGNKHPKDLKEDVKEGAKKLPFVIARKVLEHEPQDGSVLYARLVDNEGAAGVDLDRLEAEGVSNFPMTATNPSYEDETGPGCSKKLLPDYAWLKFGSKKMPGIRYRWYVTDDEEDIHVVAKCECDHPTIQEARADGMKWIDANKGNYDKLVMFIETVYI